MINNLKIFLCVILCVAAFGGANQIPAQTVGGGDKILVAGKQPLLRSQVDKVIEFYEWAFETAFSAGERERFQAISIEAFRRDAAASHKNADVLIGALEKIRAKDEAAQRDMRQAFNADFVKELRVSDDPSAQLLLGVYERGQRQAAAQVVSGESPELPKAAKSSSAAASSNKLVGKWVRRAGGGRGDDGTGKTTYNSGEDTTFAFYADGTMQFTYEKRVLSIIQCRTSEVAKIPGTYVVEGDQLTINLGEGTSVGTSTCEKADNFKKTLSASSVKKSFVVRKMKSVFRPDEPLLLCFDGSTEDSACFERDPKF